jgi:hypothetical protein
MSTLICVNSYAWEGAPHTSLLIPPYTSLPLSPSFLRSFPPFPFPSLPLSPSPSPPHPAMPSIAPVRNPPGSLRAPCMVIHTIGRSRHARVPAPSLFMCSCSLYAGLKFQYIIFTTSVCHFAIESYLQMFSRLSQWFSLFAKT